MKRRRSRLWELTKEELTILFENCNSINGMMKKLGLHCGSARVLKAVLKSHGFDLDILEIRKKEAQKNRGFQKTPIEQIMVKDSPHSRWCVRRRILKEGIIPYKCAICSMGPEWLGKPLSLVLDHINGIRNDHRKENLRFLCPCCNSQTETFTGKKNCKPKRKCKCGNPVTTGYERCFKCAGKIRRKERPTKEQLEKLLWIKPTTKIAQDYNVTDKAVEKWSKEYGLSKPPRGYWTKYKGVAQPG